MITDIHISQEIFANDILTALKPSLEHNRKHVLRLLGLYGDQDQETKILRKIRAQTMHDKHQLWWEHRQ